MPAQGKLRQTLGVDFTGNKVFQGTGNADQGISSLFETETWKAMVDVPRMGKTAIQGGLKQAVNGENGYSIRTRKGR